MLYNIKYQEPEFVLISLNSYLPLSKHVDRASLVAQTVNNLPAMQEIQVLSWIEPGVLHGLGRSPGEGNGNPLQYSCLENAMDGGVWRATVHGVAKSRTQRNDFTFTFCVCMRSPNIRFALLTNI